MVCSCTLPVSGTEMEKLQFGPLYDQYKSGDLSLSKSYHRQRSIIPSYLKDCCADIEMNFKYGEHWKASGVLMILWYLYTASLYIYFFLLRDKQPIKIRDIRVVTLFIAALALQSTLLNISAMTSGTNGKYLSAVGTFSFMLYLYFHLMRAVRLLFIYKWHEARAYCARYKNWFMALRFVLEFRFYVGAGLALLVFVLLPLMLVLVLTSPSFTGDGRSVYSTARCDWWNIPEEYTYATTNSTLCGCVRAAFFKEGDKTTECTNGIIETCFSGSSLSSLESDVCSSCIADSKSTGCQTAIIDFYTSGSCGFPSITPYFKSCAGGVFGDRYIGYTFAALIYFVLALNLLALIPIIRQRDFFGLVTESLLMIAVTCPMLSLIFLSQAFKSQTSAWWPYSKTSVAFLFGNVYSFLSTTVTLAYPIALYYLYWYKTDLSHAPIGAVSVRRSDGSSAHGGPSSDAPPSPGTASQPVQLLFETRNAHEKALQQCITSKTLQEVYLKFSVDEFTTESAEKTYAFNVSHVLSASDVFGLGACFVLAQSTFSSYLQACISIMFETMFTEECHELFQRILGVTETPELHALAAEIYHKFIRNGSEMEVNISSKIRSHVTKALETLRAFETKDMTATGDIPVAQGRMLESLKAAFREVIILMARSSWPKFLRSRHYPKYKKLLERETQVELSVQQWMSERTVERTEVEVGNL